MAAQDNKDSLDVLQDMFNEALIQTGKALRASRQEDAVQTLNAIPFKLPDTLTNYHNALDKIDKEITRAKAVFGRDLERIQNKDADIQNPQPIEAQTKSPMVIDIESSPVQPRTEPTIASAPEEAKPVAPFPDMGMDIPAPADFGESAPPQAPVPDMGEMQPVATMVPEVAPEPATKAEEVKPEGPAVNDIKMDAPSENFTEMQFTLAPAETDAPNNADNQDQPFDMASFAANEPGNGTIDLNSLLPASTEGGNDLLAAPDFGSVEQVPADGTASGGNDAAFDGLDLDNMDWGGADGSDFNFDINDDGSFNDLMKSHDNMNEMQHGLDADFFGLDNNEGT